MGERERNLFWRKILKLFGKKGGSWIYRTCLFVEAFASLEKQLTVGAKIFEMVFGGFTELPPNGNI